MTDTDSIQLLGRYSVVILPVLVVAEQVGVPLRRRLGAVDSIGLPRARIDRVRELTASELPALDKARS